MRNVKAKFLKDLARANMPADAPWEEYEEIVTTHNVIPERKLIEDLTDEEQEKYALQIAAAQASAKDDVEAYIMVPRIVPSITRLLTKTCVKHRYRELKKRFKNGTLKVTLQQQQAA